MLELEKYSSGVGDRFAQQAEAQLRAFMHNPECSDFNPDMRQLLHVGYKVAAQKGEKYINLVRACKTTIARNVPQIYLSSTSSRSFPTLDSDQSLTYTIWEYRTGR